MSPTRLLLFTYGGLVLLVVLCWGSYAAWRAITAPPKYITYSVATAYNETQELRCPGGVVTMSDGNGYRGAILVCTCPGGGK